METTAGSQRAQADPQGFAGVALIGEAEAARSAVQFTTEARFYQDGTLLRAQESHDHKSRIAATIRVGIGFTM